MPIAWGELDTQKLYSAAWQWDGVAEMAFIVVFATVAGYVAIPFAMRYIRATSVSISGRRSQGRGRANSGFKALWPASM